MEQALSHVARRAVEVLFTPHLVPTMRGILATCYARPAASGLSTARLLERYREFYADEPCVVVVDDPSGTKATYGANVVHTTVRFDMRTETVLAIGTIDNLVKGASGQAIQTANILLGLPETTGLPLLGRDRRERRMSVTAAAGLRRGWAGVRHQGFGRTRPRGRRHAGSCAAVAAGVFTTNLAQAAPVQVSARAPR